MHNRSPWRTPARGPPANLLECLFFIYSLFKCFLLWCSHTTSLLHILCCTYYCKYIYRLILPLLIRFAHSLLSPVYSYGDNAGGSTFFHFAILQTLDTSFFNSWNTSRLSTLHFLTVLFRWNEYMTWLSFHASSYFASFSFLSTHIPHILLSYHR